MFTGSRNTSFHFSFCSLHSSIAQACLGRNTGCLVNSRSRRYCAQVAVSSPSFPEPRSHQRAGFVAQSLKHLQLPPQWPRVLTDGLHGRASMPQRGDDDKHFVFFLQGNRSLRQAKHHLRGTARTLWLFHGFPEAQTSSSLGRTWR